MESIFALFLLIFIISSIVNKSKNSKEQVTKTRAASHGRPAGLAKNKVVEAAAPTPAPAPAPAAAQAAPMAPRVSVTPHDHSNMYAGSLGHDGYEGNADAFESMPSTHSEELFQEHAIDTAHTGSEESVEPSGIQLSFSPGNIAQAFILQEVLKRPDPRSPRGYKPAC